MTLPANEPSYRSKKGGVSTCTVSDIFKRNVSVLASKTRELKKMPSITIHRYTATPHLRVKSAWQLYARMRPSILSKKNAIKQKCRRLTRQTTTSSSDQVLSMLNEKFIIIPKVHFVGYTLICCLLKTGKFFFINLPKYAVFLFMVTANVHAIT